jgi:predicted phosphoribosyltransferase
MFHDRREAGVLLAELLGHYSGRRDAVVLGVPRGGVPVAYEVAKALDLPLDVFVLRKLGVPGQEELAFGAICSGGVRVLDESVIGPLGLSRETIEAVTREETAELERRERAYRGERRVTDLRGKIVLLVDDGIATGSSVRAGVRALRQANPEKIVIAAPVAPADTLELLREEAEEVVCAEVADEFYGVGQFYDDFRQVPDDDVVELLEKREKERRQAKTTGS